MHIKKGVRLKFAISFLVILTVIITTIINWYSSYYALRSTLTENYLDYNYQYSTKIALSTNDLLLTLQKNINSLAAIISREEFSQKELDDWKEANGNNFNAVFTTDSNGVIKLMSPMIVKNNVKPGTKITTDLMKKALKEQKPFISNPYLAQTGQLMILISSPLFDNKGNYMGLVDGSIYLESESSLNKLLNIHKFNDGSKVVVVDNNGHIIYHPNPSKINKSIADHPLIKSIMKGKSGSAKIINTEGSEYFTGYSMIEGTGWGVITQTPTSVMNKPLYDLTGKVILQSLPLLLIILIIVSSLTSGLSRPLNTLAQFSEEAANNLTTIKLPLDEKQMRSNIYEIRQLYNHVNNYLSLLNSQIKLDGLTNLRNRRSFDVIINEWLDRKVSFSIILLDIDHFKAVNDTYGHLVGDDVIRHLSRLIERITRKGDYCFRYGGEEFAILTMTQYETEAYSLAEQLRKNFSETQNPTGQQITISLGISSYQKTDQNPEDIIMRADSALYYSKENGRNRTTIYSQSIEKSTHNKEHV